MDNRHVESEIKVGQPIQSPSFWRRLRQWWERLSSPVDRNIVDQIQVKDPDLESRIIIGDLVNQIKVGSEQVKIDSSQKNSPNETELAQFLAWMQQLKSQDKGQVTQYLTIHPDQTEALLRISAEGNMSAAAFFAQQTRKNFKLLIPGANYDYSSTTQYFDNGDLGKLAERWQIPALIVYQRSRSHFMLGLTSPELINGIWQILVYDPLRDATGQYEEYYLPLTDKWNPLATKNELGNQLLSNGLNLVGPYGIVFKLLEDGQYNLRLYGDPQSNTEQNIIAAKRTKTQFTPADCGPLSLFAAAVRLAYSTGANGFKESGRDLLEKDTGVKILTREEILRPSNT